MQVSNTTIQLLGKQNIASNSMGVKCIMHACGSNMRKRLNYRLYKSSVMRYILIFLQIHHTEWHVLPPLQVGHEAACHEPVPYVFEKQQYVDFKTTKSLHNCAIRPCPLGSCSRQCTSSTRQAIPMYSSNRCKYASILRIHLVTQTAVSFCHRQNFS